MLDLCYRNPRIMVLVVSLILVSGLSSYMLLPRMEDPLLTPRAAIVNTRFPGADAERVESLVTEKLEEELREIDEIKELRSVSRAGISTMTIELRDNIYDVDPVWSRIRDKIDDATPLLPTDAMEPEFEQLDVKAYALIVALKWAPPKEEHQHASAPEPATNYAILRRLAEQLEDELKSIVGTEDVDLFGDPDEEILVEVDVAVISALGLTVEDVARQVGASDAKAAAGQFRGAASLLVEIDGELDSLDRIGRTPIRSSADARFVMLSDIATIRRTITDPPSDLAIVDGLPAIAVAAMVRETSRVDQWSKLATDATDRFAATLPAGIELTTVFEQNTYVATRLTGLLQNLLLGGLAVAAVIFLMMGWRSAIIVSSALPLSALIVLSGMRFLGIPIHQMSVTGLIVALGLLIDNAIVIVDEVSQKLREGATGGEAVRESVRHLAVPLFGSTITTALAFAPIALMPGPAGEFVGSIAVSVILAIFSSLFLALTIVPAITALGIPVTDAATRQRWWAGGLSFASLTRWYSDSLQFVFRRPVLGVLLGLALPIAGFIQFRLLPEQFFPPADRDQFQIEVELSAQMSVAETTETVQAMRQHLLEQKGVESVTWFIGKSAPSFYYNLIPRRENTPNYAQAIVHVESVTGSDALIHRLQGELDRMFPKSRVLVRQLEQGPPFDAPVEVRLFGPDQDVLKRLGEDVRVLLTQVPDVIHTRSDTNEGVPKIALRLHEEEIRLAGLDHATIARQLNNSLEGSLNGSILEETEELPIRVRTMNANRGNLGEIVSTNILRPAGAGITAGAVPLSALADVTLTPESSSVTRLDGRRMNEVQAYLTAGVLPAVALKNFVQKLDSSGFQPPPGYSIEYGGEAAERNESVGNLMANVGVLAVMMIATLVLSFSSFRIAGIVASIAILAAGLGLGSLWLFGFPFGFMAIVGTMGLIGVAINDAIVVLAAIRGDAAARQGDPKAVQQVVLKASRHVVATTLTTIAGFMPLILSEGDFWPPLGITIAGGVGGATILALYFAPSAYILAMCPGCVEKQSDDAALEQPSVEAAIA